jgi:hypothetical protein
MSFSPAGPLNLTDVSNDSSKNESFEISPETFISPSGKVSDKSPNENPSRRIKIGKLSRAKSLLSIFHRDNQKGSFPTPHNARKSFSHVSITMCVTNEIVCIRICLTSYSCLHSLPGSLIHPYGTDHSDSLYPTYTGSSWKTQRQTNR